MKKTLAILFLMAIARTAAGAPPVANSNTIGLYDIYELTVTTNDSAYANPWEDAVINADFKSPTNKTSRIGGFYYDKNTFKVRFAPRETGTWTWTLAFPGLGTYTGSFRATPSSNKGFLKVNPTYSRGFITEGNNKGFHLNGVTDCIDNERWRKSGDVKKNFIIDDAWVTAEQYFDTLNAGGNNFFRIGLGNCGVLAWGYGGFNVKGSGKNAFDVNNSKFIDEIAAKLHRMDWKVMLTFGGGSYEGKLDLSNAQYQQATLSLHKYILDRWGAYVDIWELLNEAHTDAPGWSNYTSVLTSYIRSYDAYGHLVTTNFMDPKNPQGFDVDDGLHAYMGCDDNSYCDAAHAGSLQLDASWVNAINAQKAGNNLPLIASEAGNHGANGHPTTGVDSNRERYRIGLWTTFFNQMAPVWWYTPGPYSNSAGNMYIGPMERRHGKVFADYVADYNLYSARPISITMSDPANSRGYATAGNRDLGAWIVHSTSHSTALSGGTITLAIPSALTGAPGYWMDPATGNQLQSFTASSGRQTLTIPAFTTDIVLRIHSTREVGSAEPSASVTVSPPASTTVSLAAADNAGSATRSVSVASAPRSTLKTSYLGVTGEDKVGQKTQGPDNVPDIHLSISGLRSAAAQVVITNNVGGVWKTSDPDFWVVGPEYRPGGKADFWIEPYSAAGTQFHIKVTYADGTTDEADSTMNR